jgi:hypothetical protein
MTLTAKVVTACIIILGIYDLFAVSFGGEITTISWYMQCSGFDAPFVVFTVGFIAGHIFGYLKPDCPVCRRNKNNLDNSNK